MESVSDEITPKDGSSFSAPPELPQSQVLNDPDLLELIFSFFHVRTPPQSGPESLARRIPFPDSQHLLWASLASKAFHDPAMDVLWRSLDSWLPLLRLISILDINGSSITSNGVILREHVETMVRYAKRVRHIRIMALRQTISPFVYGSIGQLLGDQFLTLIPALNSFDIPNITELSNDHIQCLFLLPCSMISDVTICGIGNQISEVIAASLIHRIAQASRIVKNLKLDGRITSISLNMIHQFERLETLRLDMKSTPFSRQILYEISQMTALKRVSLTFDGSCTFPIPSSPRTSDFPSLQHLEISSSAQIALMISLYITTPRLNFLTLHFSSLGLDTNSPGNCLQRITDMANFLKSIQITSSDVNTCIPGADLACLGSCPLLENINISVDYLTAQTFTTGFEQWPSVKYMRLVSNKVTSQLGSGPLKSLPLVLSQLNRILSLCPKLETLLISIVLDTGSAGIQAMDMQASSSQAHNPGNATSDHSLRELVFLPFTDTRNVIDENSSATVLNAFTVSRFIDSACPYIKNFDLSQLTDINRDWRDGVQTMVKELQQMRNPPKKLSNKKIKENST